MIERELETYRALRQSMKDYIERECLLKKQFKLSAGGESKYYFDIKKASLNGEFLSHFSDYVLDYLLAKYNLTPSVVGGMTIGADFLTAGLLVRAYEKSKNIQQGSIVRKESKSHGTETLIENSLANFDGNKDILVIDDVVTSGGSIEKAYQAFIRAGYRPIGLLTVVDREEGGMDYLDKVTGLPVIAIFRASEFKLENKK